MVHPGYVRSRNDGQTHWVGAAQLLSLYRLPRGTPHLVLDSRQDDPALGYRPLPDDIDLYPRFDGNYPRMMPVAGRDLRQG